MGIAVVGAALGLVLYRRAGSPRPRSAAPRGATLAPIAVVAAVALALVAITGVSEPAPVADGPWWLTRPGAGSVPATPPPGCSAPTPADGVAARFTAPCDNDTVSTFSTVGVEVTDPPDGGGLVLVLDLIIRDVDPVPAPSAYLAGLVTPEEGWRTTIAIGLCEDDLTARLAIVWLDEAALRQALAHPPNQPWAMASGAVLDQVVVRKPAGRGC